MGDVELLKCWIEHIGEPFNEDELICLNMTWEGTLSGAFGRIARCAGGTEVYYGRYTAGVQTYCPGGDELRMFLEEVV